MHVSVCLESASVSRQSCPNYRANKPAQYIGRVCDSPTAKEDDAALGPAQLADFVFRVVAVRPGHAQARRLSRFEPFAAT